MRAARSAESRASAVRRAAAEDPAPDPAPAPTSAPVVPVVVVEDIRGEDADPGADLFTTLEALALALAFAKLLLVAYPLVDAGSKAKLPSEPLFVRRQSFSQTCLS